MTPAGHFLQLKHICIPHQILVHRSGAGAALGNAPDHQALASAAVTGGKNAFRWGHVVLGDQIAPAVPRKTKDLCHIALAAHKPRGNQPPVFGDIVPGRAQAVPVQHGRIGAVPGDHGQHLVHILCHAGGQHGFLPGHHPVRVAPDGVDFTVMEDVAVGMGSQRQFTAV